MKLKISTIIVVFEAVLLFTTFAYGENIDPANDDSQYAYGENVGWFNFEPNRPEPNVGATVNDYNVTGFIWAENIGWINLSPTLYGGVLNDGNGVLSGYGWGENVGWINFDPNVAGDSNNYGVTIDNEGNFEGWAWGENIGWIQFQSSYKVDWDDLANFVAEWLDTGAGLTADLDDSNDVDFVDYSILGGYWLDYCPAGWELGPAGYKYKLQTSWTAGP